MTCGWNCERLPKVGDPFTLHEPILGICEWTVADVIPIESAANPPRPTRYHVTLSPRS